MTANHDNAGVRVAPPLVFAGVLIAGLLAERTFGHPGLPLSGHFERELGVLLLLAGFAIMLTAVNLFRAVGTEVKPWTASSALVTQRVYRWTRNPMYLGMTLIYAGAAIFLDSPVALLLLPPLVYFIQQEVILREERYLEARFGDQYRDYKASVRRWI